MRYSVFTLTAGRVTDPRRVCADERLRDMAKLLETAHAVEHDAVAEVQVWGRRIHAELDLQRAIGGERMEVMSLIP